MTFICKLPTVEILKQALKKIEDYEEAYGCLAVQEVIVENSEFPVVKDYWHARETEDGLNPEPFQSLEDICHIVNAEVAKHMEHLQTLRTTAEWRATWFETRAERLKAFRNVIAYLEQKEKLNESQDS